MIDARTITLAGPTGSGKSLIGGIIAKVLHERGAEVELLLDGCPAADSGIDLSGFAVVMRDAPEPTVPAFEVTGPPVSEITGEIRSRVIAMGIEPRRVIGLFVDPTTGLLSLSYLNGKKWPHHRQETAEEYAAWKAAESKADPMPPVGPLTSTANLKRGDVLRDYKDRLVTFKSMGENGNLFYGCPDPRRVRYGNIPARLIKDTAFVARPGVWMPYTGSENPAPGLDVRVKEVSGIEFTPGPMVQWDNVKRWMNRQIVAFMVVPDVSVDSAPPPSSATSAAPSTRTIAPSDIRDGDHLLIHISGRATGQLAAGEIDRNLAQRLIDKIGADHVTVELISRPIAVGDKVIIPAWDEDRNDPTGVVRFIDDDGSVMVRCEDDRHRVFSRCELSPVA